MCICPPPPLAFESFTLDILEKYSSLEESVLLRCLGSYWVGSRGTAAHSLGSSGNSPRLSQTWSLAANSYMIFQSMMCVHLICYQLLLTDNLMGERGIHCMIFSTSFFYSVLVLNNFKLRQIIFPVMLAKSKWRGLRDYFRQQLKRALEQPESMVGSSWAHYDEMSFLAPSMNPAVLKMQAKVRIYHFNHR